MLVDYVSSEGVRITYDTGTGSVTCEDLNRIAMLYAELHPDRLPSYVFMNLEVYGDFSRSMFHKAQVMHADPIDGQICVTLMTATGILIIKPMPAMYKELNVVVGTEHDLQNILVDRVFEEVVLKDCERE